MKNDFRDILNLSLNCESRKDSADNKCSLRQCVLRGSMCHSRELNSMLEIKGGGERKREIVVFFLIEKYLKVKFFGFQHSTKDLNENKDEDVDIYISE